MATDTDVGDSVPARRTEPLKLHYFEEVLGVELDAIDARRRLQGRGPVQTLFGERGPSGELRVPVLEVDPRKPDYEKTRPQPKPCTATGLAFSGGGIRSAAVCLGALQALKNRKRIDGFDYLSTVSGGGYIGSCLSAAMARGGEFPFGDDIADSPALAHLRDFSNYLMPRGRSTLRNGSEAAVIILRGFLANAVVVSAALIGFAIVTLMAFPDTSALENPNFFPRFIGGGGYTGWLLDVLVAIYWIAIFIGLALLIAIRVRTLIAHLVRQNGPRRRVFSWIRRVTDLLLIGLLIVVIVRGNRLSEIVVLDYGFTLMLSGLLCAGLLVWAMLRSIPEFDAYTGDTKSWFLTCARILLVVTIIFAFLDLQAVFLRLLNDHLETLTTAKGWSSWIQTAGAGIVAISGGVSVASSTLGRFLKKTERATGWTTLAKRAAAQLLLIVAAMALPLALWVAYLALSLWGLRHHFAPPPLDAAIGTAPAAFAVLGKAISSQIGQLYVPVFALLFAIGYCLKPNSYSLHRLYRDRLSKAFLFGKPSRASAEPPSLDDLKLSALKDDNKGPYHIINAAMNVQGSKEANRRGRDADFFMFTRDFVGSDLTLYGHTREPGTIETMDMERIDPRLDLATAMAVSGAAVSANMGGNTVRLLSPTLALLNIRLGYWLRNPRDLAMPRTTRHRLKRIVSTLFGKFYLLLEMLNQLDETSQQIYLSDGGHIENLGVYELLKRGCELIVVVDAEADPTMSFPSLLKLERYARIDLGVRIALPWQRIAQMSGWVSDFVSDNVWYRGSQGPHCAVGKIFYANGAEGVMVYFKSSITGDEKDYILDYKRRYPDFPHETTGDQFFTEEQFENYRALGFHMVDGFLGGTDTFEFLKDGPSAFPDGPSAFSHIDRLMPQI